MNAVDCPAPTASDMPDRDHLENSRPLDWDRVAVSKAGKAAVGHLLERLEAEEKRQRARRAKDRARLEATLEVLVMDLYAAARAGTGRWGCP